MYFLLCVFQPDDVVNVAVDKINNLLESFMGINDTELCKLFLSLFVICAIPLG